MLRLLRFYGKYQSARGAMGGMPVWARWILFLAAAPGLALILLSIAAFLVSLLALLILTVPVYRVLRSLTGAGEAATENQPPLGEVDFVEPAEPVAPSSDADGDVSVSVREHAEVEPVQQLMPVQPSPRRQIEVRIIEQE
jgi:hypothetical protein